MASFRRLAAVALVIALIGVTLAATVFLSGCRKEEELLLETNLAPDTRLTSAPAKDTQANYRVHLYWNGTDPDGYVVGFYFAWDDTVSSAWTLTNRTDSLFKALIDTAGETRRHTFYIRAVDNEGRLDPSPARIRFDAKTDRPVVTSLFRRYGPSDPDSMGVEYTAGGKDTVLMGSPCVFVWDGEDPDGLGAPVEFSYRLDSYPFSDWSTERRAVVDTIVVDTISVGTISSGTHFFYVKAKDETGSECFPSNYKFVMNYSPDSWIIDPPEPTGTLTVGDSDTLWITWDAQDKEEQQGLEGGIKQIWIRLDAAFQKRFDYAGSPYTGEWWFTSNIDPTSDHYIDSANLPTGGNRPHEFWVWAKDVENRSESSSSVPEAREKYVFWYNHPPTTEILWPSQGETVGTDFEVCWSGTDIDGEIEAYQYVLDPRVNSYKITADTCVVYTGVAPGEHEFRVRARDKSDCWQLSYETITFIVE